MVVDLLSTVSRLQEALSCGRLMMLRLEPLVRPRTLALLLLGLGLLLPGLGLLLLRGLGLLDLARVKI